jgi:flagellar biosynthetic protein FliR/FlhB
MSLDPLALSAQLFTAWLLLLGRVFGLFTTMPAFGERNVPWQAKAGLSMAIAFVLLPASHAHLPLAADNMVQLACGFVRELIVGFSLGYLARLMFGAFQFAVSAIDFSSGLSMAEMLVPGTTDSLGVMSQFLNTFMLLLFLEMDGHHLLLRALARSVAQVPLGYGAPPLPSASMIAELFAQFVTFGIQLALPVVLVVLVIDLSFGLIGRVVPQLNVFLVALPVKILVSITTLTLILPVMATIMGNLLNTLSEGLVAYLGMMR